MSTCRAFNGCTGFMCRQAGHLEDAPPSDTRLVCIIHSFCSPNAKWVRGKGMERSGIVGRRGRKGGEPWARVGHGE